MPDPGSVPGYLSLPNVVAADTFRAFGSSSLTRTAYGFVFRKTFRPVVSLRLTQHFLDRPRPARSRGLACRLVHRWACGKAGIDLPWNVRIGPGFYICHGWGLVVNEDVSIGSNVTAFHGVTLGRADSIEGGERSTTCPTIGDDVWLGANSFVAGDLSIGSGARVLAGTVVTDSVPPASMVGGNPGRVLKGQVEPDVVNRFVA